MWEPVELPDEIKTEKENEKFLAIAEALCFMDDRRQKKTRIATSCAR